MPTPEIDFSDLDILLVNKVGRRRSALARLAAIVGKKSHGDDDPETLAGAELAPSVLPGLSTIFHVDEVKDGEEPPWLMTHIVLRKTVNRPSGAPAKLRKSGHTTEWLLEELGAIVGEIPAAFDMGIHGVVQATAIRGGLPPFAMVGGRMMEPVGVEYRTRGASEEGPVSARLRQRDGALEFWLRYRIRDRWTADLWARETQRSEEFLRDLVLVLG